jgi:hypothetical protein
MCQETPWKIAFGVISKVHAIDYVQDLGVFQVRNLRRWYNPVTSGIAIVIFRLRSVGSHIWMRLKLFPGGWGRV